MLLVLLLTWGKVTVSTQVTVFEWVEEFIPTQAPEYMLVLNITANTSCVETSH